MFRTMVAYARTGVECLIPLPKQEPPAHSECFELHSEVACLGMERDLDLVGVFGGVVQDGSR